MSTTESPQVQAPRRAPVPDKAALMMGCSQNRRLSNFRQVFSAERGLLGESVSTSVHNKCIAILLPVHVLMQ